MKENIIYSNILNETEFLRSLTLKGINSFGTKVLNFDSIVREAAIRSGYDFNKQLAHNTDIEFFLSELTKDDDRFRTYEDVAHLTKSLHDLRLQLTSDNELEEFREKVVSVFRYNENINLLDDYFEQYLSYLEENKFIDSIQLARRLIKQGIKIFAPVAYYSFNLTPFEKKFLEAISNEVKQLNLFDMFNLKRDDNVLIEHIDPYYGERSEIEGVIEDICKNKYPLDECLIVTASDTPYAFLAYDYSDTFKIPLTSEIGFPIHTNRAFKFYQLLNDLEKKCAFDVNGYKRLLNSGLIDLSIFFTDLDEELINCSAEVLGRLKIRFDKDYNTSKIELITTGIPKDYLDGFMHNISHHVDVDKLILSLQKIANCFGEGLMHVLYTAFKYSKDKLSRSKETAVLDLIYKALSNSKTWTPKYAQSYIDRIDSLAIEKKCFSSAKLHLTNIENCFSTIRKYVYFVGLSAENFPGKPNEDYLLPDVAYEILGIQDASLLNQRLNKLMFDYALKLFASSGSEIHLSFSCQNIADVKGVNPSSEIFKYADKLHQIDEEYSLKKLIDSAGFYQNDVRRIKNLIKEYKTGKKVKINNSEKTDLLDKRAIGDISISPSNLHIFEQCRFKFYYQALLWLRDESDYDSFDTVGANIYGSLLHLCLEISRKNNSDVRQIAAELFDYYSLFDVSRADVSSTKEDFVNMCLACYNKYSSCNFLHTEFPVKATIEGLKFGGKIDAVIQREGKTYILDYKTGRKPSHKDNDVKSCSQGIAYALMYQAVTHEQVSGVLFYYPRFDSEVLCELTPENISFFNEYLEQIKNAYQNRDFVSKGSKDFCRYCHLKSLCGKEEDE